MAPINKYVTAIAVGLAMAAVASPSLAQRSENHMSREEALRDCNAKAGKMSQSTWGDHQIHMYRSCMSQHGLPGIARDLLSRRPALRPPAF